MTDPDVLYGMDSEPACTSLPLGWAWDERSSAHACQQYSIGQASRTIVSSCQPLSSLSASLKIVAISDEENESMLISVPK